MLDLVTSSRDTTYSQSNGVYFSSIGITGFYGQYDAKRRSLAKFHIPQTPYRLYYYCT